MTRDFGFLSEYDRINVIVKANAKKTQITDYSEGVLKVDIKAVPENGKANQELVKFLQKEFKQKFKIVKGFKSSRKTVARV